MNSYRLCHISLAATNCKSSRKLVANPPQVVKRRFQRFPFTFWVKWGTSGNGASRKKMCVLKRNTQKGLSPICSS